MQAIKSTATKEEVRLAKTLWSLGYRYRKNNRKIFGKPDLTFTRLKIAIFIDSEFFHGKNWKEQKLRLKSNIDYWIPKIERNMQRDIEVNTYLRENGWTVLRFWSAQIKKDLDGCVAQIQQAIQERKAQTLNNQLLKNS